MQIRAREDRGRGDALLVDVRVAQRALLGLALGRARVLIAMARVAGLAQRKIVLRREPALIDARVALPAVHALGQVQRVIHPHANVLGRVDRTAGPPRTFAASDRRGWLADRLLGPAEHGCRKTEQ